MSDSSLSLVVAPALLLLCGPAGCRVCLRPKHGQANVGGQGLRNWAVCIRPMRSWGPGSAASQCHMHGTLDRGQDPQQARSQADDPDVPLAPPVGLLPLHLPLPTLLLRVDLQPAATNPPPLPSYVCSCFAFVVSITSSHPERVMHCAEGWTLQGSWPEIEPCRAVDPSRVLR